MFYQHRHNNPSAPNTDQLTEIVAHVAVGNSSVVYDVSWHLGSEILWFIASTYSISLFQGTLLNSICPKSYVSTSCSESPVPPSYQGSTICHYSRHRLIDCLIMKIEKSSHPWKLLLSWISSVPPAYQVVPCITTRGAVHRLNHLVYSRNILLNADGTLLVALLGGVSLHSIA
jgi:hypothetical protein